MQGLLNPWSIMGAGLLQAGGPHFDPSNATLGAGLSQGLNGLMGLEQLNMRRQAQEESSALSRQKLDLLRQQHQSAASSSQREIELRGLLADQIAKGDKKGAAQTLSLLGEVKESIGLLDEQAPGAFEGTGMTAQALNAVAQVNQLQAEGRPIPPALQRQFDLAKWHLMQPKPAGVDPITGQPLFTNPPPLPGLSAGPSRQASARSLADIDPAADIPLSEVMGAAPSSGGVDIIPQPESGDADPNDLLQGLTVGKFLTDDEKRAFDFPQDAKVQVIGSRGGAKSLKVIDSGTKIGAEAKRTKDRMSLVNTIGQNFLNMARQNQSDVGPLEGRATRFKSGLGMGNKTSAQLVAMENQMKSMLGTALSGAAIPVSEWPTYMAMVPNVADNMEVMEGKAEVYDQMIQIAQDIESGKATRADLDALVSGKSKPVKTLKWGQRR